MFEFATDVWTGLATLDPTVRAAGFFLLFFEALVVIVLRALTEPGEPAAVSKTPLRRLDPRFHDAA